MVHESYIWLCSENEVPYSVHSSVYEAVVFVPYILNPQWVTETRTFNLNYCLYLLETP